MSKYIDAEKLIDEIKRRMDAISEDCKNTLRFFDFGKINGMEEVLSIIESLQQEKPEADLEKEEFVGVAESPLKTFPRVNDFECGGSYRH